EKLPERHLSQPSLNIAGIWGGYTGAGRKTIVAGEVAAKIDCRLVVNQEPQKIMDCIRRHLDKHGFEDIEVVSMGHGSFPSKNDPDSALVRACEAASRRVYGADPVVNPLGDVGSTPVWSVIRHLGIPTVGTGVGYITARTHSVNENLKIEHLTEGAKFMAAILDGFGDA
ncbi:M20/M25/M40 family metallo-hydrolase, partial [Nitrospinota bacterium]